MHAGTKDIPLLQLWLMTPRPVDRYTHTYIWTIYWKYCPCNLSLLFMPNIYDWKCNFLWSLMSVCWLVGWLIGRLVGRWFFKIGRKFHFHARIGALVDKCSKCLLYYWIEMLFYIHVFLTGVVHFFFSLIKYKQYLNSLATVQFFF